MQIQELLGEYLNKFGVVHGEQQGEGAEVDIVGRIDGLRRAKYCVSDGDTAAEDRRVFYIIDTAEKELKLAAKSKSTLTKIHTANSRYATFPLLL